MVVFAVDQKTKPNAVRGNHVKSIVIGGVGFNGQHVLLLGKRTRGRTVKILAKYGGICRGSKNQTQRCSRQPCPINCKWRSWLQWSTCSATCGGGKRTRGRTVKILAKYGGICRGSKNQTQRCSRQPCPINCKWRSWLQWSTCSATCGGGKRTRGRTVKILAKYGGICRGSKNQTQRCSRQPCPINCKWRSWLQWSTCSATCGGGKRTRKRTVKILAKYGGICRGSKNQTQRCSRQPCQINCKWRSWLQWSTCSATCGGGKRTRKRTVKILAKYGGICRGSKNQTQRCSRQPCQINCKWRSWLQWSTCSATCGGGKRTRKRTVKILAKYGGICRGSKNQTQRCSRQPCPINCKWRSWGQWSRCSATCGAIRRTRTRTVRMLAKNGGKCPGQRKQTVPCYRKPCPGDCVWDAWDQWTKCSVMCGTGKRTRNRKTIRIPAKNGGSCLGSSTETESCRRHFCHHSDTGILSTSNLLTTKLNNIRGVTTDSQTEVSQKPPATKQRLQRSTSSTLPYFSSNPQPPTTLSISETEFTVGTGTSIATTTVPLSTMLTTLATEISTTIKAASTSPAFPLSDTEALIVTAIQTLGCAFILISLSATLVVFLFLGDFSYERFLHMNMEIGLLFGHILVLTARDITHNPILCKLAGIGFQFFFLGTFTFMMLEALQAYCIRTNVISFGGYLSRLQYFVVGWGIPGVITSISSLIKHHEYISTWSCWLNLGSTVTYFSTGPVLVLSAAAFVIAEAAGMGNYSALYDRDHDQWTAAVANSKALFLIVPLSTASWFCGLFAVYHVNVALYSVVHGLNISLGVSIFVFHSLGNPKVHAIFKNVFSFLFKKLK